MSIRRSLRGSASAVIGLALASWMLTSPAAASSTSLVLNDCATDIAGRTFILAPDETLTVTFSQACVWGYSPSPYAGFAPSNPGSQSAAYPLYDSSSQLVADVQRSSLPGQVVLTFIARAGASGVSTPIYFTYGSVYQAFQAQVQAVANTSEVPSHSFGVPSRGGTCPTGWVSAGWEAWAQTRVCNLTTEYDLSTRRWSHGTYDEVMTALAAWRQ
jgi:hypothetical protein